MGRSPGRCRAVPCRAGTGRSGAGPGGSRRDRTRQGGTGRVLPRAARGSPRADTGTRSPGGRGCSGEHGDQGTRRVAGHPRGDRHGWARCPRGARVGVGAADRDTGAGLAQCLGCPLQVRMAVGGSPCLGGGCQQHPWARVGSCMLVPLGSSAAAPSPAAIGAADTPTHGIEIAASPKLPRWHRVCCSLPGLQGSLGGRGRLSTGVPSWEKRTRLGQPQLCKGSCEGYFCCARSMSHVPFLPGCPQWQEVPAPLGATAVRRDAGRSFTSRSIHGFALQVPCYPRTLGPWSFAHGLFLQVSRALGTLVPGEAEPAENALCLPPGQPQPSQAPAPCCARPGSSAGSGPYPTASSSGCASARFRHELAVASSAREFCRSQSSASASSCQHNPGGLAPLPGSFPGSQQIPGAGLHHTETWNKLPLQLGHPPTPVDT